MNVETILREAGLGLALPGGLALAAGSFSKRWGRAAGAIGCAAGWLVAVFALDLFPIAPNWEQSWSWLPALAVAAGVIGASTPRGPARAISSALLAGLAAGLLVPAWESLADARNAIRIVVSAVVFALAMMDHAGELEGSRIPALVFAFAAGVAAFILERGGTASFAQMAGALAATWAGLAVFGHRPGVVSGGLPVFAVLHAGLLASGRFNSFSEVPLSSFVLAALAPLSMAIPLPNIRHKMLIRFGLVAVVAAVAVVLAVRAEPIDWSLISGQPVP